MRHSPDKQIALNSPNSPYADYVRFQYADFGGQTKANGFGATGKSSWPVSLRSRICRQDRHRPPVQTYRGNSFPFKLDGGTNDENKRVGPEHRATLYMTLLACFRWSYIAIATRTSSGWFTNGGSQRARLGRCCRILRKSDCSAGRLFRQTQHLRSTSDRVRNIVLEAFEHQDFPFPLLVERLQPERDRAAHRCFKQCSRYRKRTAGAGENLSPFALGEAGAAVSTSDHCRLKRLLWTSVWPSLI